MLETISNFYRQFEPPELGLSLDGPVSGSPVSGLPEIIYVGMGGSALPADLLNDYLAGVLSIKIVNDYAILSPGIKDRLCFCVSYSGNTEETLSALAQAQSAGAKIITLGHGGKLEKIAKQAGLVHIPIPACVQPRCATGYFFSSILAVLAQLGFIEPQQVQLKQLSVFLKSQVEQQEKIGKELAKKLFGLVPIIYGPSSLYGATRTFKIKFNENSKIQSFFNVFPELNHNEMVGFTKMLIQPAIIYLKSKFMHPRLLQRMQVMEELLQDKMPFHSIQLEGENLLQEMFSAVVIGDMTSYYLALEYGIDPAPVGMVEDFKRQLDFSL